MSRILYLIFILFLTIVFSSVIQYEYFSTVFDLKFKESNNTECEPSATDFEQKKFKIKLCNDFGVKIKVFMRTSNGAFNNNYITNEKLNKCVDLYLCQGNPDTRVVDIENDENIELSFGLNQNVEGLSIWMIKMDSDTMGKMIDDRISFFEKTSEGPIGSTSFELSIINKGLDYNISYVEGISTSIITALYKNTTSDVFKSGCNLPNKPTSTKGELKRYKYLGMNRILASKYKPNISDCDREQETVCELSGGLLTTNTDSKYDACGDNLGDSTLEKHKCRTHIAVKIQDEETYCGYLFKNNCPYSWAYGEFICIDPDVFNSESGTFNDKLRLAGVGPKAINCGYNDNDNTVANHFNWPNLTDIRGSIPEMTTSEDTSSGSKPYPIPDTDTSDMGKYWYNTRKNCEARTDLECRERYDTIDGIPDIVKNDINVGSFSGNSLNHRQFIEDDSIILNITFKKIEWL